MRYGLLLLLVACTGNEATGPPDLTGSWTGANTVAALDVRLSNVVRVFPCGITFGCSGSVTVAMIRLEGALDTVTYVTTRLVGRAVDDGTIAAAL